ncbi:MAG: hypothetical protein ACI9DC_001689 [Gammaproteobacteria bacterium]
MSPARREKGVTLQDEHEVFVREGAKYGTWVGIRLTSNAAGADAALAECIVYFDRGPRDPAVTSVGARARSHR